MDETQLRAEFKRLTEGSERPVPELWSEQPDPDPWNVLEFDDFMWRIYREHGLLKLWELYDSVYGEEDRPMLRKIVTDFIERRSRNPEIGLEESP